MTRKEIVQSIFESLGLTQRQTATVVERLFDGIVRTLVEEGRVELRNFGIFEVRRRAPRKGRNPRTGEKVDVPERFTVKFTPGQIMQQRVADMGDDNQGQAGTSGLTPGRVTSTAGRTADRAG